ncbi:hypothetical protein ISG24_37340, partial [Burkholderia pseudomallei]|nr:hypothetical protein [Burkholderia pseudomallei]
VNQSLCDWERVVVDGVPLPRTAGVSAFGAGGTNAHLILSEYPADACAAPAGVIEPAGRDAHDMHDMHDTQDMQDIQDALVVPLSARNAQRLHAYAQRLRAFVAAHARGERGA